MKPTVPATLFRRERPVGRLAAWNRDCIKSRPDWVGSASNSSAAPYSLLDGSTSRGIVQINQQINPSDFTEAGVSWQTLASALIVTSGTLTVELSNQDGQVTADAVRIEKVADISAGTPVLALVSGAPLGSGDSINFGTTFVGQSVNKPFTVTNAGTADLTLGDLIPPSGFSIVNNFGANVIAPGQSTSFTLQLTADTADAYSGNLSFTTNDVNNATFHLDVSGNVLDSPSLLLSQGSTLIAASSTFSLGSTYTGVPIITSFTVQNLGLGTLKISNPVLPNGYSLFRGIGATTLANGESTSFSVRLDAAASGTYDGNLSLATNDPNQPNLQIALTGVVANSPAQVVGRYIFYGDSAFDGNIPAPNDDDTAIATDKTALLPGQTATFANITSYNKGINGVMIDIAGLSGTPTASDFAFSVGNDNNPW